MVGVVIKCDVRNYHRNYSMKYFNYFEKPSQNLDTPVVFIFKRIEIFCEFQYFNVYILWIFKVKILSMS